MEEGTLLYIYDYEFEKGAPKNKYFLFLKVINERQLIVSLPSSIEYFPTDTVINHGCIDLPQAQQTTYCFKAKNIIDSRTNFSFPLDTYLHGCWLKDDIDETLFFQSYPIQGIHYEIEGVLNEDELIAVIQCFKQSSSVKRRIKKLL